VEGENMKQIPKKNYIIAIIIVIITVLVACYLANYFMKHQQYENETNGILSFLSEVKAEELDSYITENRDVMIYLSNSDIDNSDIQKKVKKVIKKNDYKKDIIYLNAKNLDEDFYVSFASKYFSENLENTNIIVDSLLIIKDGSVNTIVNLDEDNVSELKKIIEKNYYGEA
jgi:hypothetical protein